MGIDWKAYWRGQEDCVRVNNDCTKIKNPYKKNTVQWESWNYGWNMVDFVEDNYEYEEEI